MGVKAKSMKKYHVLRYGADVRLKKSSVEERKNILREYNEWKWNFPKSVHKREVRDTQTEIENVKNEISKLQELLERLNNENEQGGE
jgi:hypothetical protein